MLTLIEKRFTLLFEMPRYFQPVDTACPKDHEESSLTKEATVDSRSTSDAGDEKAAARLAS